MGMVTATFSRDRDGHLHLLKKDIFYSGILHSDVYMTSPYYYIIIIDLNIRYYLMLFYCILLHYIILRPCLYTFNVSGLPHLFGEWIAQVVETPTLEMGWLPTPYKRLGWPLPILFWRWPLPLWKNEDAHGHFLFHFLKRWGWSPQHSQEIGMATSTS